MIFLEFLTSYAWSLPTAVLFLFVIKKFLPIASYPRQVMMWFVSVLVVNPIIWIGDAANILFVAAVLFTAILLLCGGYRLARFSVAMLLFCVIVSASAVFSNLRPPLDKYVGLFSFLLWCGIALFVKWFIAPQEVQKIRPRLWQLLDMLVFLPFMVTVVIVICTEFTKTAGSNVLIIGNERVLVILLILAAVYAVGLLLAVALLAKQESLERQQILWTVRQQHYENLEQHQLQVRRLRHDMANHLNAMSGMDDNSMRKYLAELVSTAAMTAGRRFCEHETANAVLSGKQQTIEQQKIQARIDVSLPENLPLSNIDVCAVFSNCIDNAIEACQKCKPENRKIKLEAKATKGILALRLENSMTGTLDEENGILFSSKSDKANHGLGMAEIRDIVQRHRGILKYEQNDDVFVMQLSIPLADQAAL